MGFELAERAHTVRVRAILYDEDMELQVIDTGAHVIPCVAVRTIAEFTTSELVAELGRRTLTNIDADQD